MFFNRLIAIRKLVLSKCTKCIHFTQTEYQSSIHRRSKFLSHEINFSCLFYKKLLRLATVVYIILFKTFAYAKGQIYPLQIVIKNNETFQPKSLLEIFPQ